MNFVKFEGIVFSLTAFLESIAQSDEIVDFGRGGFVLTVGSNGKEGANQVDIGDHAVVFLVSLSD